MAPGRTPDNPMQADPKLSDRTHRRSYLVLHPRGPPRFLCV